LCDHQRKTSITCISSIYTWARLSSLFFLPKYFHVSSFRFSSLRRRNTQVQTCRQSLWHMVLGVFSQVLSPLDLHFEVDHHMTGVLPDFTISSLLVWWTIHSYCYQSHHDNFMMKLLWLIWIRYENNVSAQLSWRIGTPSVFNLHTFSYNYEFM